MAPTLIERLVAEDGSNSSKKRTAWLLRAIYGEFCCTTIFFLCVFSAICNTSQQGFDPFQSGLVVSLTAALTVIAMIFCYSDVSGANFNMAISFALWLTGKLSNRKLLLYWTAQLSGALLALGLIALVFQPSDELWNSLRLDSGTLSDAELARAFFKEFIATFVLTYIVFHLAFEEGHDSKGEVVRTEGGVTVYTTAPNSKGAFTPFVFGFLLFGLLNINGAAMNPLRILAPAIVGSGSWACVWVYVLGELAGAALAGILVHFFERLKKGSGLGDGTDAEEGEGAEEGGWKAPLLQ